MRSLRYAVALAVPLLLLTACGELVGPAGRPDVAGRTFLSSGVTEDGAPRDLVEGTRVRLSFTDEEISASAGCNTMGGTFRIIDGTLLVGDLAMTEMGCPDGLAEQDTWLAGLLGAEPALSLEEDTLTLTTGSTVLTLQDREVADPDLPLQGTVWRLDSFISGDAVSSVPAGVEASLTFGPDGTLEVQAGCNTGSAPYTLGEDGTSVSVGDAVMTLKACDDERGLVERMVMEVLSSNELEVDITARTLTLQAHGRGLGLRGD
ncbi:META domain-containing protein [Ornithinimicrobium tianjinense]|uniref:META domain-containing protein n=1 Tax=Ornithinimicrobium tianjinense TaxID=1195761 RepID=UPI001669D0C4|nr:META domain-containing protein [Ornithinimicrobium tianjinense]